MGIALTNSDNEIATQPLMSAIIIIPYTVTIGPPEEIPVTRDADMPNQLLAELRLASFVDFLELEIYELVRAKLTRLS